MSLAYKQNLELTIFGYIRLNYGEDIIDDIKQICLAYYNNIEICWDIFCDKLAKFISDDQLDIHCDKPVIDSDGWMEVKTFASSIGWNKGIHTYKLEISFDPEIPIDESYDMEGLTTMAVGVVCWIFFGWLLSIICTAKW